MEETSSSKIEEQERSRKLAADKFKVPERKVQSEKAKERRAKIAVTEREYRPVHEKASILEADVSSKIEEETDRSRKLAAKK